MMLRRPRVRITSMIVGDGRWQAWAWTIFTDSWPAAVGRCKSDQDWFSMCALEDWLPYPR